MKTYKVYKHPINGYEAVKVGFSWPAFFLGPPPLFLLWMLSKKLWGKTGTWFLVLIVLQIGIASQLLLSETYLLMLIVLCNCDYFALWLVQAFKGNSWRTTNLEKRGFELVQEVQAKTPSVAMAQAQKGALLDTGFLE